MNIFRIIIKTITLILLFTTVICGFYLHFNKANVQDFNSSVNFHMVSAILTVIFLLISFLLPGKQKKAVQG